MISRLVAVLAAVALCILTACTSSGRPARQSSPPPSKIEKSTVAITQPSSVPTNPPNRTGAISRGLVAITSCTPTPTGWQAVGTARGENGKAASYTITIFFTTAHATVEAYGVTRVRVPAGRTRTWTVTKSFPAVAGTLCLIRGAG